MIFLCFINSFYRFVLEPELISGVNNGPSHGPVAKFLDIPESHLLTLNMITPEGWLVETVHSNCDLDNINLEDVSYCVCFSLVVLLVYIGAHGHVQHSACIEATGQLTGVSPLLFHMRPPWVPTHTWTETEVK